MLAALTKALAQSLCSLQQARRLAREATMSISSPRQTCAVLTRAWHAAVPSHATTNAAAACSARCTCCALLQALEVAPGWPSTVSQSQDQCSEHKGPLFGAAAGGG